uniref:Uncharacterized protein n=1 Tax=Rhizophora mucronata TaxID=61149 RepID=A0A2P2N9U2_RHIMU
MQICKHYIHQEQTESMAAYQRRPPLVLQLVQRLC